MWIVAFFRVQRASFASCPLCRGGLKLAESIQLAVFFRLVNFQLPTRFTCILSDDLHKSTSGTISAHFWSKVKKPIKVCSTKRWKPKSRSPPPVFIPRPRHLPFIYRGTRDGRSLKKKLQPLRRLTQKFRFFALSRLLVLSLVQPFSGGGWSSSESWLGVLFFVVGPSHIFIWRPRCFFFLSFVLKKKTIFKKRLFDFVIT